MLSKIVVENRGEIAIRTFRAAYELDARTDCGVAIIDYPVAAPSFA